MDLKVLWEEAGPWEWPQGLEKQLLAALRDKSADHEQRMAAVAMAGDYTQVNDTLADALIAIVEDAAEPEDLRGRAAISFGPALEQGDIEDFIDPDEVPISEEMFERIKDVLMKVYLDPGVPKLVRRRALEGSIRAPEDWHKEEVRKAYQSDDAEWKLTAVFCMNHLRGFNQEVMEALKSQDPKIHLEAVKAAGSFEIAEAWPHIAALAQSERTEKDLRIAAIEALSTLKPEDSLPILIELSDSEDEEIAEAADEAQSMAVGFLDDGEDDDEFDEDDDEDDEKPKPVN